MEWFSHRHKLIIELILAIMILGCNLNLLFLWNKVGLRFENKKIDKIYLILFYSSLDKFMYEALSDVFCSLSWSLNDISRCSINESLPNQSTEVLTVKHSTVEIWWEFLSRVVKVVFVVWTICSSPSSSSPSSSTSLSSPPFNSTLPFSCDEDSAAKVKKRLQWILTITIIKTITMNISNNNEY